MLPHDPKLAIYAASFLQKTDSQISIVKVRVFIIIIINYIVL